MNVNWKRVKVLVFGYPEERCSDLSKAESCHRHKTVPIVQRIIAAVLAPLAALAWTLIWALGATDSKIIDRISEAEERTGYGIDIAISFLVLIVVLSTFWTLHVKCTSVQGYITAGLGIPFTIFSIITPMIAATIQ